MASHDIGWEALREELRLWIDLRGVSSRALADMLTDALAAEGHHFDQHVVKRWRHSTSPPLVAVRHIAAILEMSDDRTGEAPYDPAFILRRMGLLASGAGADELVDTSYRLQQLRLRLLDVRASLGEHSARFGAGRLVQTAMSHGFAAAVHPVWEGPAGYPMHVADRVDFRPVHTDDERIDASPAMRAALVENFAAPGERRPRFSTDEGDLAMQSHWAIPLIGRPAARSGQTLHPHVRAVAVSSATPGAWADDVGAVLAWLLGYGFVSTREIAGELTTDPLAAESLRAEILDQFLAQAPERHVWSHHGVAFAQDNPSAPWTGPGGVVSSQLFHVRLVEDDSVIDDAADHLARTMGRDALECAASAKVNREVAAQRLAHRELDAVRERVLLVDVTTHTDVADRWTNALTAALVATRRLHELGVPGGADLVDIHERLARDHPDIAPNLLRWFADHDCPLVSPKFATSAR